MPRAHLQLVILAVDDVARARDFYVAAFGWRVTVDLPVYVEMALPGGTGVSVYQREGFAANTRVAPTRSPAGGVGSAELYVAVDDLDDAVRRLRAAGARELAAPEQKPWGDTAAYFADPDGHVVAVAVHPDEDAPASV